MSEHGDRVPPHSEEAEMAAIGSILLDPVRVVYLMRGVHRLTAEAFFFPGHRTLVRELCAMIDAGKPVDLMVARDWLSTRGVLEEVGGHAYLDRCVDETPTAANANEYLDIVRQNFVKRGIIDVSRQIGARGYWEERGDELLREAPSAYMRIVEGVERKVSNKESMERSIAGWRAAKEHGKPAIGITMPWEKLTEVMCGLEPGITIIAGRPSAGKTTLEDIIAVHAAMQGVPVGRITLDASQKELLDRAMCRRAGVSLPKLKFGWVRMEQLDQIEAAKEELEKLPLFIEENISEVQHIETAARMMRLRYGIGLLTLDYLQQVRAHELGRDSTNMVATMTHASGLLKKLALEMKIPALVLSQLSREVEKENRAPKLSDLRDSGAIEQDAHKVVFLYRDMKKWKEMEEQEPGATRHKRPIWVHVMKHKDGETRAIPFWLYPPYFRMEPAGDADFSDDELPASRHDDGKLMEERPEYLPLSEGERPFSPTGENGLGVAEDRKGDGSELSLGAGHED